jgi:hypothetical protein
VEDALVPSEGKEAKGPVMPTLTPTMPPLVRRGNCRPQRPLQALRPKPTLDSARAQDIAVVHFRRRDSPNLPGSDLSNRRPCVVRAPFMHVVRSPTGPG